MEKALDINKSKYISAEKGLIGFCEICGEELIPRCGEFNKAHWSHKSKTDCDPWSEGLTEWHREWQGYVDYELREVVMTAQEPDNVFVNEKHRADIRLNNGVVVEIQHSPISVNEIAEREAFYKNMFWVFDLTDCKNIEFKKNVGCEYYFSWKYAKKHMLTCKKTYCFDMGTNIFIPFHIYKNNKEGKGLLVEKAWFVECVLKKEFPLVEVIEKLRLRNKQEQDRIEAEENRKQLERQKELELLQQRLEEERRNQLLIKQAAEAEERKRQEIMNKERERNREFWENERRERLAKEQQKRIEQEQELERIRAKELQAFLEQQERAKNPYKEFDDMIEQLGKELPVVGFPNGDPNYSFIESQRNK